MSEPNIELYRIKKLKEVTGLGDSSIWARLQPTAKQYDPSFPRPISLSATGKGAVAWVSTEVQDWIRSRIERSRVDGTARLCKPATSEPARPTLKGANSVCQNVEKNARVLDIHASNFRSSNRKLDLPDSCFYEVGVGS